MRFAILIIVGVLVLGGGAFGVLVLTGTIHLTPPPPKKAVAKAIPKGWKLAPMTFRSLPAGTKITREMLIPPKSNVPYSQPVDPAGYVKRGKHVFYDPNEIKDRVLAHDKRPNSLFTEEDFLPIGTDGGIQALIPPGYRGVTLAPGKLTGSRTLIFGNHIDIISTQVSDVKNTPSVIDPNLFRSLAARTAHPSGKTAYQEIVATDAVVITPPTVQQVPGKKNDAHYRPVPTPIEEMMIGVKTTDVPGLLKALAEGAQLSADLRTGRPVTGGGEKELALPVPPQQVVLEGPSVIETIKGKARGIVRVPSDRDLMIMEAAQTQPSELQPQTAGVPPTLPVQPAPMAQPAGAQLPGTPPPTVPKATPAPADVDPTDPGL